MNMIPDAQILSIMKTILCQEYMDCWFLEEGESIILLLDDAEQIKEEQVQNILNKSPSDLNNGEYLCLCLFHIIKKCLAENFDLSNMYIFEVPVFREKTSDSTVLFTSICFEDDVKNRYVDVHILIEQNCESRNVEVYSNNADGSEQFDTIAEGVIHF